MDNIGDQIISWRRHLHQHPELSGQERETAAFVAQQLRGLGLQVREGVGGYGVLGLLPGRGDKKCAALRADMDALPIEETEHCPFRSQNPGVMHACGHDAHTAVVLGAAAMLAADPPAGSVKFLFQPHEEQKPGGARGMMADGALEAPAVDGIFATHVTNEYPAGSFALQAGPMMAASDDFELDIHGRSSHGACPQHSADPIVAAAAIISAAQSIISRRIAPQAAAVLTVGAIKGGVVANVIPDLVQLKGTVRSFEAAVQSLIFSELQRLAEHMAAAYGCRAELRIYSGYPALHNPEQMAERLRLAVQAVPGAELRSVTAPPLGGEDFAIYGRAIPIGFIFTGTGSSRCQAAWHQSDFDVEETALPLAAQVLAAAARALADEDK